MVKEYVLNVSERRKEEYLNLIVHNIRGCIQITQDVQDVIKTKDINYINDFIEE